MSVSLAHRLALPSLRPQQVALAKRRQGYVELVKIFKRWDRAKEVVFDKAVPTLHAALLIALSRRCELHVKDKSASKCREGLVLVALVDDNYRGRSTTTILAG